MTRVKQQHVLFQKGFFDKVIQKIAIENQQRTIFLSAIIYMSYAVDYMIFWAIEALMLKQSVSIIDSPLPTFIARLVFPILFIFFQHPIFFFLSKVALLIQMTIVTHNHALVLEAPNIALELLMCFVWALTKEQRNIHVDSRKGYFLTFLKQLNFYTLIAIENIIESIHEKMDKKFLILLFFTIALLIDHCQFYYSSKFKTILIKINIIFIGFLFLIIDNPFFQIEFFELLCASVLLIGLIFLELCVWKKKYYKLLAFPLTTLEKQNKNTLAVNLVELKMMIDSGNQIQLQFFLNKMSQQIPDKQIQIKLDQLNSKSQQIKRKFCHCFLIQTIKNLSQKIPQLNELLINLYSPDPIIFSSFNIKDWYHRRQYYRILNQCESGHLLEEFEFQKQKQQIQEALLNCSILREKFCDELVKEKVNQDKILSVGNALIEQIEAFILEKQTNKHISPQSFLIFYKFSDSCLGPYFTQKISNEGVSLYSKKQTEACLIVGARGKKKGKILHFNRQFQKICCYGYSQIKKLEINDYFRSQWKQFILQTIEDKYFMNQQRQKLTQKKIELVWINNSMGFMTICELKLVKSYHCFEQCLKIYFEPLFSEKAIVLIDKNGKILGISELSRYYNYQLSYIGQQIDQNIFNILFSEESAQIGLEYPLLGQEHSIKLTKNQEVSIVAKSNDSPFDNPIYAIEFRQSSISKSQPHIIDQPELPDFQFNFDYSGKITTKQVDNHIPEPEESIKRNLDAKYGENITEMRYFNDKMDYKANYDEENDCLALPRQQQEDFQRLSEQQFLQKVNRKKLMIPFGLKLAIFILALLMLVNLGAYIFMITSFNQFSVKNSSDLKLICKNFQQLDSVLTTITLTTVPLINMGLNESQLIKEQIKITSQLSDQIYQNDPYSLTITQGQTLKQLFSQVNLNINEYLLNPNNNTRQTALALVRPYLRGSFKYTDAMMLIWQQEYRTFQSRSINIGISIGITAFLLVVIMFIIQIRIDKEKQEIMVILKSIQDDILIEEKNKSLIFREVWLQNGDEKQFVEKQSNQNMNFSPTKRVKLSNHITLYKILLFLWLLLALSLFSYTFFYQVNRMNVTASNYYNYTSSAQKSIVALHSTWHYFNLEPIPTSQVSRLFMIGLKHQSAKHSYYNVLIKNKDLKISKFVYNIWNSPQFCSQIKYPDCPTIIGEGTKDGASMVVNYISLQFNTYLTAVLNGGQLSTQPNIQTTGRLIFLYLYEIVKMNSDAIVSDFNIYINKVSGQLTAIFVVGVFLSILLLLFMWYNKKFFDKHGRHRDILLTLPFDKLNELAVFHRYYHKYYAHH